MPGHCEKAFGTVKMWYNFVAVVGVNRPIRITQRVATAESSSLAGMFPLRRGRPTPVLTASADGQITPAEWKETGKERLDAQVAPPVSPARKGRGRNDLQ